jgi:hypothetical protein
LFLLLDDGNSTLAGIADASVPHPLHRFMLSSGRLAVQRSLSGNYFVASPSPAAPQFKIKKLCGTRNIALFEMEWAMPWLSDFQG